MQMHTWWDILCHQIAGRLREQDLPAMGSTHNPRRIVEFQAHVSLGQARRCTGSPMRTRTTTASGQA